MNNVVLIGRLTRDPELSYTPQETAVCHFTLAVDRPRKNGQNTGADFIRIVVWERQAEICDKYLTKGSRCAVRGRIQTGSYKDKNGNNVYTTDVVADFGGVEFLSSAPEKPAEPQKSEPETEPVQMKINVADLPDTFQAAEDDIPF